MFLPINYPGRAAPVAELTGQRLLDGERSNVLQHLQQLFTPGEVVLFSWVEWLREQEHLWHDEESKQQQQAEEEEPTAGQAEPLAEVCILPSSGVWAAMSGDPTTFAQLHSFLLAQAASACCRLLVALSSGQVAQACLKQTSCMGRRSQSGSPPFR